MIPGMETKEDFNASGGELLLYELLAQLPDEYYVFHSTRWNEKLQKSEYADAHRYIQWGEADFTIFHPAYGFIVFEVKDGQIAFDRQRGWIQINRYSGHEKIIDPMEQAERSKYFFWSRSNGDLEVILYRANAHRAAELLCFIPDDRPVAVVRSVVNGNTSIALTCVDQLQSAF